MTTNCHTKKTEVISDIIKKVKKYFVDLSILRGNRCTFLGMNIEIKDNIILVDMVKQLEEYTKMFGEYVNTPVSSSETKNLFEVREDSRQLSENKGKLLHLVVAKLLFIMKTSRPDLETAMSFLTTRVSKSGIENWENLRRILRFI